MIDLDLYNVEQKPVLTRSAVANERQDASSKSTIDEMADAITGGWPSGQPIYREKIGYGNIG